MKNTKVIIFVLVLMVFSILGGVFIYLQKGVVYEDTYERYNEIVEKAASSRNPNICDKINFGQNQGDYRTTVEESRYFCRADYATMASDAEYCKTLDSEVKFTGSITQKDKCLKELAKKLQDKSLCEFMSDKIYCPI